MNPARFVYAGPWPAPPPRQAPLPLPASIHGTSAILAYGTGKALGPSLVSKWESELARALLAAASRGDAAAVHLALERRADVASELAEEGSTALHLAVARGSSDVVQLLLVAAANPLHKDSQGSTALDLAIHNGHGRCVVLLAQEPAVIAFVTHGAPELWTRTLWAILAGCPSAPEMEAVIAVQQLLSARRSGADLDPEQPAAITEARRALFVAVTRGWEGGVAALFAAQANVVNSRDPKSHRSALELAEALRNEPIAELLRSAGAQETFNASHADWAACLAAARGDVEALRYWLEQGAIPDWREPPPGDRSTALMFAAAEGHVEAARLLLQEGGVCAAKKDLKGRDAAALARSRDHRALADVLRRLAEAYVRDRVAAGASPQAVEASLLPEGWVRPSGWQEAGQEVDEVPIALVKPQEDKPPPPLQPPTFPRVLRVKVVSGVDLEKAYLQFTCNPAVGVRLQGMLAEEAKYTQTISGERNPTWNHEMELLSQSGKEQVLCTVYSQNFIDSELEVIGRMDVNLNRKDLRRKMLAWETVTVKKPLELTPPGAGDSFLTLELHYPLPGSPFEHCRNDNGPHDVCDVESATLAPSVGTDFL